MDAPRPPLRLASSGLLVGAGLLLLVSAGAPADTEADLRRAAAAFGRRDFAAAAQAARRAFEAQEASEEQRRQALDALARAAIAAGRPARLLGELEKQRPQAPPERRALLLAASVRCRVAADGHPHKALQWLAELGEEDEARSARYLARQLREHVARVDRSVRDAARELGEARPRPERMAKPRPEPLHQRPRPVTLADPRKLSYEGRPKRLDAPAPEPPRGVPSLVALRPPRGVRPRQMSRVRVTKPPPKQRRGRSLAPLFFSRSYRRAAHLAQEGRFEEAKREYATIIELFPDTPQAQQAARYAVRLFQRERGVRQGAEALAAYLAWLRKVLGPQGSDYAEYLAFERFGQEGNPAVIAREARAYLERHPESDYAPGVRLHLAIALDRMEQPQRAIEVLEPLASPPQGKAGIRAAHILAWLYIFQGQGQKARPVLQALARQEEAEEAADRARKLLEQMEAHPPRKTPVRPPEAFGPIDEILAEAILRAGGHFLRQDQPERAMDLWALYLRVGEDAPGFWAARGRIERLKQEGRARDE
ncbi:MAG: hypothetical protein ACLF0G_11735 [Candidatus Brocadiia bacterium]